MCNNIHCYGRVGFGCANVKAGGVVDMYVAHSQPESLYSGLKPAAVIGRSEEEITNCFLQAIIK